MNRKIYLLFLAAVVFSLDACAVPARHYRPNPSNPVYTVALLPMYNATNDVDGPRLVRQEFFKRIQNMHYSLMPLKEVDNILLDQMGITLGSQLEMTNAKQLGEALRVDGVIFGYLLNFDNITTGLYNVKKVRAGFKLVDTKTGQVLWARGFGVKSALAGGDLGAGITIFKELMDAREGIDAFKAIQGIEDIPGLKEWHILYAGETQKAGNAAALAIGEKILTKALGVHLMLETDNMLNRVLIGFPVGPGAPHYPPERGPDEADGKREAK